MPSHEVHREMDRLFLGKEFPLVHIQKDLFAPLFGKGHRRVGHDDLSNIIIALFSDDPLGAYLSGRLHDMVDRFMPYEYSRLFGRRLRKGKWRW